MIRRLALISALLAAIVIVFGAYVRLNDAGLGCPDWPGCYGALSPHHAADSIGAAESARPLGPVSMPKAWKEMIHRYLASTLGLAILVIAIQAWRRARENGYKGLALPLALLGGVVFQGLLGMWTVTLLLKPAIVTLHLLGGLTVMAMLLWLYLRERGTGRLLVPHGLALSLRFALILLVAQIALGGWVSSNYAALACTDFPSCHGTYAPTMDFANAFHVLRELGMTAAGTQLSAEALTAIHWTHRIGAVLVGTVLLLCAFGLARRPELRVAGLSLGAAVCLQIGLGVANVLLFLPLHVAVSHNAGAVLLVAILVYVNYRVVPSSRTQSFAETLHEIHAA